MIEFSVFSVGFSFIKDLFKLKFGGEIELVVVVYVEVDDYFLWSLKFDLCVNICKGFNDIRFEVVDIDFSWFIDYLSDFWVKLEVGILVFECIIDFWLYDNVVVKEDLLFSGVVKWVVGFVNGNVVVCVKVDWLSMNVIVESNLI